MHKLVFFVPFESKEPLKKALFLMGLGRYENYDSCSWETDGVGQFRPLSGSDPHIGEQGALSCVSEFRVEMLCPDHLIDGAIATINEVHPYEEPAFELWPIRIS